MIVNTLDNANVHCVGFEVRGNASLLVVVSHSKTLLLKFLRPVIRRTRLLAVRLFS